MIRHANTTTKPSLSNASWHLRNPVLIIPDSEIDELSVATTIKRSNVTTTGTVTVKNTTKTAMTPQQRLDRFLALIQVDFVNEAVSILRSLRSVGVSSVTTTLSEFVAIRALPNHVVEAQHLSGDAIGSAVQLIYDGEPVRPGPRQNDTLHIDAGIDAQDASQGASNSALMLLNAGEQFGAGVQEGVGDSNSDVSNHPPLPFVQVSLFPVSSLSENGNASDASNAATASTTPSTATTGTGSNNA